MSDWKKRFTRQALAEPGSAAKALRLWGLYLLALLAWVAVVHRHSLSRIPDLLQHSPGIQTIPSTGFFSGYGTTIVLVGICRRAGRLGGYQLFFPGPAHPASGRSEPTPLTRLAAPTEEPITLPDGTGGHRRPTQSAAREQALRVCPGGQGGGAAKKRSGGLSGPRSENTPDQRHWLPDPAAGRASDLPGAAARGTPASPWTRRNGWRSWSTSFSTSPASTSPTWSWRSSQWTWP